MCLNHPSILIRGGSVIAHKVNHSLHAWKGITWSPVDFTMMSPHFHKNRSHVSNFEGALDGGILFEFIHGEVWQPSLIQTMHVLASHWQPLLPTAVNMPRPKSPNIHPFLVKLLEVPLVLSSYLACECIHWNCKVQARDNQYSCI